jgi:hypothetical protein
MSSNVLIATPNKKSSTILSRKSFVANTNDNNIRLGTFVAQGIAGQALGALFFVLYTQVVYPDVGTYAFFFFTFSVVFGIPFGLLTGLIVGAIAKGTDTVLALPIRFFLGIALTGTLFIWLVLTLYVNNFADGFLPIFLAAVLLQQVGIALLVGSSIRPIRVLTQGFPKNAAASWPTKLVGFLMRSWVTVGLVESILIARLYFTEGRGPNIELQLALLAAAHFAVAFVATFINFPLWLTTLLILIANSPIGYFLHRGFENSALKYTAISYLALWLLFLVSRIPALKSKITFLKDEFRYYLID